MVCKQFSQVHRHRHALSQSTITRSVHPRCVCTASASSSSVDTAESTSTTFKPVASVPSLCMELGISEGTAFRLQQQYRNQSAAQIKERTLALASLLRLGIEETAVLAGKEPFILASLTDARDAFNTLCDILPMTRTEAARLIAYSPSLLTMSANIISAKFQALADSLEGVPLELVSALVAKQPYVLTSPAEVVSARFETLASLLGVSQSQVLQLLGAYPMLMVEPVAKLEGRLQSLCGLLQADVPQVLQMAVKYPPVLVTNTDITAARVHLLADLLQVSTKSAGELVLTIPAVFTVPSNELKSQFDKLFTYFSGMDKDAVLSLVSQNPALLGIETITQ